MSDMPEAIEAQYRLGRPSVPVAHPLVAAALTTHPEWESLLGGLDRVWVTYFDGVPSKIRGRDARPAHLGVDPVRQNTASTWTPRDASWRNWEVQPSGWVLTHRAVTVTLDGEEFLDVPVARFGRADSPCSKQTRCQMTCAQCGTGDYWLLPQFDVPAETAGISDPNAPHQVNAATRMMVAMVGHKYLKVRLTPHASIALGPAGSPLPRTVMRLKAITRDGNDDTVWVKDRHNKTMGVRPSSVELL